MDDTSAASPSGSSLIRHGLSAQLSAPAAARPAIQTDYDCCALAGLVALAKALIERVRGDSLELALYAAQDMLTETGCDREQALRDVRQIAQALRRRSSVFDRI